MLYLVGLGIWAVADCIFFVAINPSLVNINISANIRAGEEAIGIMS